MKIYTPEYDEDNLDWLENRNRKGTDLKHTLIIVCIAMFSFFIGFLTGWCLH